METLRRLEDEQKEFEDYLEQLRHAKDKAEFDQFMDERKRQSKGKKKPSGRNVTDPNGGEEPQPQA